MDSEKATSVDSKEIEHFNKLSGRWWTEKHLLLQMNHLRVSLIQQGLIDSGMVKAGVADSDKPFEGLRVLDVGCGGGYISEALALLGCTVVGLDVAPNILDVAKNHAALNPSLTNLTYILEAVEDHSLNNHEQYDAVVAAEVFEHVADQEVFLEHCMKCLKPGCPIFITTLNKTWSSWWTGIILYEYVFNIITRGSHQWEKFISPEDLGKLLEKYNCKTNVVRGLQYSLLSGKWSWSNDVSVWYGLQATKQ